MHAVNETFEPNIVSQWTLLCHQQQLKPWIFIILIAAEIGFPSAEQERSQINISDVSKYKNG